MRSHRPGRHAPVGLAGMKGGASWQAVLAVVVVLALAALCVRLGIWQLDRLEQRRERNAALRVALAAPPLVLDSATLEAVARDPEAYRFRRVRVEGEYLFGAEVALRGRAREGRPGVHLLTPLEVAGVRQALLVNRGWAPAPDAATVDPAPLREPGIRTVEGIVEPLPSESDGQPAEVSVGGSTLLTLQRPDLPRLQARVPVPLLPVAIQQLPEESRSVPPYRVPPPELDEGSHLSYALQWFGFAAIALVGLLVLLLRSRDPSRIRP